MTPSTNTVNLATVILNAAPAILGVVLAGFAKANPGVPPPTDADVVAELKAWASSTLAIDAEIKARLARPTPATGGTT